MPVLIRGPTRLSGRDAFLVLLGAFSMHIFSLLSAPFGDSGKNDIVVSTHFNSTWHVDVGEHPQDVLDRDKGKAKEKEESHPNKEVDLIFDSPKHELPQLLDVPSSSPGFTPKVIPPVEPVRLDIRTVTDLPHTTVEHHAPGWTLFRDIYMSNGTLFVLGPESARSSLPDRFYVTSTGLKAENNEENIRARLPTEREFDFINEQDAKRKWGARDDIEKNRVWTVEGSTILFNDPGDQFINHYYHFVAESLFGAWAFWSSAHASKVNSLDEVPPPDRFILSHSQPFGWRDGPGFNSYFLRAAFPSMTVETQLDWEDRITHTRQPIDNDAEGQYGRAYHFPTLMLMDRSASFKGAICGSRNQRIAAESVEYMKSKGLLAPYGWEYDMPEGVYSADRLKEEKIVYGGKRGWWEYVRKRVVEFAGGNADEGIKVDKVEVKKEEVVKDEAKDAGLRGANILQAQAQARKAKAAGSTAVTTSAENAPVVITYISRQGGRRRLIHEDHKKLVEALDELVERKNKEEGQKRKWEMNVVQAERMSRDEQVRTMSRTTVLLGVHGNGLSHLLLLPPSPLATVIEMFFPQGFAHDYEYTSRALGIRHFAVWNDTAHTWPDVPRVNYPEGFQGTEIPADGASIAKLIEDRIEGRLP
ncbi:hypothetical protein JAAARDRAFT_271495 [Jaapia argillacea MUCL 33604]|uniref:Glycosyltransferase 61 catalytic domain-containing protein n=1 Tax=Jaapia argillacea MUCL 33604 TaxID=933084 RepID=A0A067PS70_9AGAM|nr:hypothetical protein JAAARDRAFT_271495 [Jaapia argillacea MUCL 33604]